MRATLRSLAFEPDPASLSAEPTEFSLHARFIVGPTDGPGDESFDITVCTPEWLARACSAAGGIYDARHHVVVNLDEFDKRAVHDWLALRVECVEGDTWAEIAERLGRLGHWEFEDYRP
ncbi:Imm8 family immunity protein [Agromyces allii]|uniref:Immunity 8 family protein n=1 Tax=Agromyces allii TaxID=393607 RepID=A0ABP5BCY8_9MICO|nr:Imm8 family immunity protein [Agromyces allii]